MFNSFYTIFIQFFCTYPNQIKMSISFLYLIILEIIFSSTFFSLVNLIQNIADRTVHYWLS